MIYKGSIFLLNSLMSFIFASLVAQESRCQPHLLSFRVRSSLSTAFFIHTIDCWVYAVNIEKMGKYTTLKRLSCTTATT